MRHLSSKKFLPCLCFSATLKLIFRIADLVEVPSGNTMKTELCLQLTNLSYRCLISSKGESKPIRSLFTMISWDQIWLNSKLPSMQAWLIDKFRTVSKTINIYNRVLLWGKLVRSAHRLTWIQLQNNDLFCEYQRAKSTAYLILYFYTCSLLQ